MLHLPLPSLSSYAATHALQSLLVGHLLNLKSLSKSLPPSLVLTMELLPTYTFGRRQKISPEDYRTLSQVGTVIKSQRGGLTTYHGPGQVVGYPLLDLKRYGLVVPRLGEG
jgi:lipoyl(octanoyl) transferase